MFIIQGRQNCVGQKEVLIMHSYITKHESTHDYKIVKHTVKLNIQLMKGYHC